MKRMETAKSNGRDIGGMAALALSMLLASLGTSIANIALPTLSQAFGAPFHEVQAVVVAYLAALTISVVAVGRLGDRFGLKRMLVIGLGVFVLASILCAGAPGLLWLTAARVLQGIGAAFLMTISMALMRETAGDERIGRAMGLLGTVSALGTALGPSLGGGLIAMAGWRSIFIVQAPLAILALMLAVATLPAGTSTHREASAGPWWMGHGALAPSLAVNLLVAAVMMATLVIGPFYLGLALGLSPAKVGLAMSVGPVVSIFGGMLAGRLVDAWGAQRILMTGLSLLTSGVFLLALLPQYTGVAGYVFAILILTPGYQLFQAANNTAVLGGTAKDRRGTVSGLLTLSRNLGLIAGASIMGALFAFGVGTDDFARAAPTAIAGGMRLAFLVGGGMTMFAMIIIFWREPRTGQIGAAALAMPAHEET
jgi:MFS family permease